MGSWVKRLVAGALVAVVAAVAGYVVLRRGESSRPGQVVRIGCSDCPPFLTEPSGSAVDRFSVEVVAAAARRINQPVEFFQIPDTARASLRAKEIEVWPRLTAAPQDNGEFFFSEPWVAMNYCLFSRRGWKPQSGSKISVGPGATQRRIALQSAPGAELVDAGSDKPLRQVCTGEIDAALVDSRVLSALLLADREDSCQGVQFQSTPSKEAAVPASVAARPGSEWAAILLREEISRMAADGSLASLHSKWFLTTSTETGAFDQLRTVERDLTSVRMSAFAFAVLVVLTLLQTWKLRKLRARAEGASLLKTRFVANVSHELRTPLSGIIGLVDMLSDTRMTAHQTELLRLVRSTAGSLVQVITDLLDVAKMEAGQRDVAKESFELREAVDEVCAVMAGRAVEKGIRLETSLEAGLPRRVLGDATRVREILMNLLGNALRHTERGEVRLEVNLDQATPFQWEIAFTVTDSGTGISEEDLSRLFDGLDADRAPEENPMNRGGRLNIAISKRLVDLLGGKMTASSPTGQGAQFRFVLPFEVSSFDAEPERVAAADALPAGKGGGGLPLRILVCEDDPVSRKVAVHLLTKLAHSVQAVTTGNDAVETARNEKFDLILMDCQLPDIDGYEAARRIHAEGASAGVPIVALTAAALAEDRRLCLEAGMTGFLSKPISLAALSETLAGIDRETRHSEVY